ncbi:hypothetical protein [uncultured Methylobacterium sp.]|jgi:hypothetical protein|uniref:hypothetical protein n=1 Tax=uncultured Methylobacterium sp. TaxID=157278 RepID=UPI00263488EC|nr:hypothetical protein [uncultured Methylobacterium sp.]
MVSRLVLALLALLAAGPAVAIEDGDLTLTVTAETGGGATPYPREMVLLRIRGTYRAQITLEELRQPGLQHFSWTQLGRDRWFKTSIQGQEARGFERVVAVFPQHAGRFTIEPFTHRLTVAEDGGRRVIDVRSAPLPVAVADWTGPGGPDAREPWWLPAGSVTVTDAWSPEPETLKVGESARRTVTVEASGLTADGLPPRPVMRTRGVLTFAGPTERQTTITPAGPVARATYQWDVRPGVAERVTLEAIRIPWFDTGARTLREAEIPARIVGSRPAPVADEAPPPAPSPLRAALAGLAAFLAGLALWRAWTRPPSPLVLALRPLRRAARRGDAAGLRAGIAGLARTAPALVAGWRADPRAGPALAAFDRALFGAGTGPVPDLRRLVRVLERAAGDGAAPSR